MKGPHSHQIFAEIESGDLYGVKRTIAAQPSALAMRRVPDGRTPLHQAVMTGNAAMVRELLKHGAVYEATDNAGNNAMHLACEQGSVAVVKEMLSESGARQICKAVNKHGFTAPQLAAERGFKEVVQIVTETLGLSSIGSREPKPRSASRRRSSGRMDLTAPAEGYHTGSGSSSGASYQQQQQQQQAHTHSQQAYQGGSGGQGSGGSVSGRDAGSSDAGVVRDMRMRIAKLEQLVHAQMELITEWHNTLASVHAHDKLLQEFEERLVVVEGRVVGLERGGSSNGLQGLGAGGSAHEDAVMRLSMRLAKVEAGLGGAAAAAGGGAAADGSRRSSNHMASGMITAGQGPMSGAGAAYSAAVGSRRTSKTELVPEPRRSSKDFGGYEMLRKASRQHEL